MNVAGAYRFSGYRFSPDTLELHSGGARVSLKSQSARVLSLLLRRAGELVSRETLCEAIWPDRVVEFDAGLNACIRDIRRALNDDAANPAFVETLPKLGYRFIAELDRPAPALQATEARRPATSRYSATRWAIALIGAAGLVLAIVLNVEFPPHYTAGTGSLESEDTAESSGAANPYLQTRVAEARTAFLRGEFYLTNRDETARGQAKVQFRRAIDRDPEYAPAHAKLAEALFNEEDSQYLDEARRAASKAIGLAPAYAEAYLIRGEIRWAHNYAWDEAHADFRQAIELDPGLTDAYFALARLHIVRGNNSAAFATLDEALARDPVSVSRRGDLGWFYYLAGDYEKSLAFCNESLAVFPDSLGSMRCFIDTYLLLGQVEEAKPYILGYLKISGSQFADSSELDDLSASEAVSAFTRAEMSASLSAPYRNTPQAIFKAIAHLRSGDRAAAIEILENAHTARNFYVPFIRVIPDLKSLRGEPRFDALIAAMNLKPAQT